jgi:hypothetical protein
MHAECLTDVINFVVLVGDSQKQAIYVTIWYDIRKILMRRTMEINYAVSIPERGKGKINTGCF